MSCRRLRQQRLDSKDVHGPYFVKNLTVPSRHSKAVGTGGVPWHPQMLTNQFILSQPKGQIMATTLILAPPDCTVIWMVQYCLKNSRFVKMGCSLTESV